MCFEGVFYPGVIANKCFEKVCVEICYANAKINTGFLNFFFFLNCVLSPFPLPPGKAAGLGVFRCTSLMSQL